MQDEEFENSTTFSFNTFRSKEREHASDKEIEHVTNTEIQQKQNLAHRIVISLVNL